MKDNDKYQAFSKNIIGFTPYTYQLKVAELLLSGKNVILSVPTGAGKTWAAILPYLYAIESTFGCFPQKMIYSLPLRTLCNSISEDVNKALKKTNFEEIASIQTGEYNEDIYFEKDIVFSTIDQTLSNFLCFPLPLSQKLTNINAGALIGSYLVFDEFHLLDSERSMATTLGALKMLGNLTRCCIMTATLSKDFMKNLKLGLSNYEIVTLDDFPEDKDKIKSLLPRENKKRIFVMDDTISADVIIQKHRKKTIVICNRVETAQKVYNDIMEGDFPKLTHIKKDNIICLHSRFFAKDRKEKEEKLKALFGKDSDPEEDAILISTQVIEAGMDITCDTMHTEISPINSFLQRVGRCARFAGETGDIYVYNVLNLEEKECVKIEIDNEEDKEEIKKLNNKYLPYEKELCEATLSALKSTKTLDGDIPDKLVQQILQEKELSVFTAMSNGFFNKKLIKNSWVDCEKNHYLKTIRDIQNVEITIINKEQCDEIAINPFRYQSVGMYRFSLSSWLKKIIKRNDLDHEDWLVKELAEAHDMFWENAEDIKYELKEIPEDKFNQLPARVFVNAKYFGYSEYFGFNWEFPKTFNHTSPESEWKEKEDELKPLKKDTFYQHNMALIGAFEKEFLGKNGKKLDFVFGELAKFIDKEDFGKEDFIRIIKLMIILHDYGKLNEKWQKPMQRYQALKENIAIKDFDEILAHTDFNSKDEIDKEFGKKVGLQNRGNHAGIGAFAAQKIMEDEFDNGYLKTGISMAIAKHHSPFTSSFQDFNISNTNYQAVQKLLDKFGFDIDLEKNEVENNLNGFEFDDWDKEQIVNLFFVRILRLCDQKATEDYKSYFKE